MGMKRTVYRSINKTLSSFNLSLMVTHAAFDSRVTSPSQLERMFGAIAEPCSLWLKTQTIFRVQQQLDVAGEIRQFYQHYLESSFRESAGGSGFNNLLWLYLVAKARVPSLIIDSGTFKGASAWALQLACPSAILLSFDIDLSMLHKRIGGVRYIEKDWSSFDFSPFDTKDALVYFDDHVDQAKRLIEAHERAIPLALFDDDYSVFTFAAAANGGFSLPKVEFVTDQSLRKEESLEWVENGKAKSWLVDVDYLDRAASTIKQVDRLPDTSTIAGYNQLPYRIVRLAV